ncbi:MAG: DNA polymerase III subunit delta' [Mariprofundaceae bacterium]|nr:DNA polymerase III subunit delta' [Mariprofundaceae bacterium]
MSFNPALGHELLHERFASGLSNRKLHHAWLLYGVKGIGKATEAMSMAALYLCEDRGPDGRACGSCHACCMLRAGSHPDFIAVERLEKKRDITVDQIREVLSFLSLSGMESERRVVLLDDAETMNIQAANALLKGLEEPASGSLLLMVCHDLTRLPATIRSRCMLGHCAPLGEVHMNSVLAEMDFTDAAKTLAVEIAGGRPGHVASLQDSAVADGLLQWRALLSDIRRADVGELQGWLETHLNLVPHELIADVVLQEAEANLAKIIEFEMHEALLKTMWSLAAWPREVVRHSLRAAPALIALLLELRSVLKGKIAT